MFILLSESLQFTERVPVYRSFLAFTPGSPRSTGTTGTKSDRSLGFGTEGPRRERLMQEQEHGLRWKETSEVVDVGVVQFQCRRS